jgi:hypothetical protein
VRLAPVRGGALVARSLWLAVVEALATDAARPSAADGPALVRESASEHLRNLAAVVHADQLLRASAEPDDDDGGGTGPAEAATWTAARALLGRVAPALMADLAVVAPGLAPDVSVVSVAVEVAAGSGDASGAAATTDAAAGGAAAPPAPVAES